MDRCPTCRARLTDARLCHRCQTDVGRLRDIDRKAREHYRQATAALAAEGYPRMFFHASRSFSLRKTPEAARTLACAAILTQRFDRAIELWRELADRAVR